MRIVAINDDSIEFDNGKFLSHWHTQQCCERVYADFEVMNIYNLSPKTGKLIDIKNVNFPDDPAQLIEKVEGMGFNLVSNTSGKFFIPCYNIQNGYYGTDLTLYYDKFMLDISDCV